MKIKMLVVAVAGTCTIAALLLATGFVYALWSAIDFARDGAHQAISAELPRNKEAVTAPGPCAKDFVYDPGANTCAVSFVFQIEGAQNLQCVKVPAKPPAELGLQCSYTPSPTYQAKRGTP